MIEWILVALILLIFYYKVIAPFSKKMLEQKIDEEIEPVKLSFYEDELDDGEDHLKELRRKVEKKLDLTNTDSEEKVRYEVLLEHLRERVYSDPEQTSTLLGDLNKRE